MPESEDPVVGLAARIVEIISFGILVRFGSEEEVIPSRAEVRLVPIADVERIDSVERSATLRAPFEPLR